VLGLFAGIEGFVGVGVFAGVVLVEVLGLASAELPAKPVLAAVGGEAEAPAVDVGFAAGVPESSLLQLAAAKIPRAIAVSSNSPVRLAMPTS
jgi:hypothetical protein